MAKAKKRWWDDELQNAASIQDNTSESNQADRNLPSKEEQRVSNTQNTNYTSDSMQRAAEKQQSRKEQLSETAVQKNQRQNTREKVSAQTAMTDVISPADTSSRESTPPKKKRFFFDVLVDVLIGLIIGVLITYFVIELSEVQGSSMHPVLQDEDIVLVDTFTRHFLSYKRGDVVVVDASKKKNKNVGSYIIKRIIALPGETISFSQGHVYINGILLEEKYLDDNIRTYYSQENTDFYEIKLSEDEYFCMGDNRGVSLDSRDNEIGTFLKENLKGRAFLKVSPIKSFGLIK